MSLIFAVEERVDKPKQLQTLLALFRRFSLILYKKESKIILRPSQSKYMQNCKCYKMPEKVSLCPFTANRVS